MSLSKYRVFFETRSNRGSLVLLATSSGRAEYIFRKAWPGMKVTTVEYVND